MTFYVLLHVCNGHCARLHEFTFTHFSPFTYFLTRNAMRKRGLCCHPVSVRTSVFHVRVLYPDGWKYRQTSFSAQLPHNSNFWPLDQFQPPSARASNTPNVGKFAIFDSNLRLSRKRTR